MFHPCLRIALVVGALISLFTRTAPAADPQDSGSDLKPIASYLLSKPVDGITRQASGVFRLYAPTAASTFIADKIDPKVFRNLLQMNDGDVVDSEGF